MKRERYMRQSLPHAARAFYFIGENDSFDKFSARYADREMKKHWAGELKTILSENKRDIEAFFSEEIVRYFYDGNGKIRRKELNREIFEKIAEEQRNFRKKLEEAIAAEGLIAYNGGNESDFPVICDKNRAAFVCYHDEVVCKPERRGDCVFLTVRRCAGDLRVRFTGVREFYPAADFYEGTDFLDFELYRRADGLYEYDLLCTSGESRIVFSGAEAESLSPVSAVRYVLDAVKRRRELFASLTCEDREVLIASGESPDGLALTDCCGVFLEQKSEMFALPAEEKILYGIYRLSQKLNELEEFSDGQRGYDGFFKENHPFDEIAAALKKYAPQWLYAEYAQARKAFACGDGRTLERLYGPWRMKNALALPEPIRSRFIERAASPFEEFKNPLDPERNERTFHSIVYAYCEDASVNDK